MHPYKDRLGMLDWQALVVKLADTTFTQARMGAMDLFNLKYIKSLFFNFEL